jgi:hypothetical protein
MPDDKPKSGILGLAFGFNKNRKERQVSRWSRKCSSGVCKKASRGTTDTFKQGRIKDGSGHIECVRHYINLGYSREEARDKCKTEGIDPTILRKEDITTPRFS